MKTIKNLNILFCMCITLILSGCVGTVEDSSKITTESTQYKVKTDLAFDGITELIPISHDKMEVYFLPATGGSKEYLYQIYIGNVIEPVNVVEQVLTKDYRSMYRYIITGLDIGTEYVIKVDVKDRNSNETVTTETTLKAFTFSNYVADFVGLSSVSNVSGISGVDSIRVRWPHAAIYPGSLLGSDRDPQSYEVTILDASMLTPKAFNSPNLGPADGRVVKIIQYDAVVNEAIIRGLVSGKIYYVNVRALHKGTLEDPNFPNLRSELNNKYFEIKTLEANASLINFEIDDYILTPSPGAASKNSLHLNWGTITGVFDHYRIFYALTGNLFPDASGPCDLKSSDELLLNEIACKKANSDLLATDLNDLAINNSFDVQLFVCINIDCSINLQLPVLSQSTGSLIAGFGGIQDINLAKSLEELGTMKVVFAAPDFSAGYFDGLAIEMTEQKSELLAWLSDPINPAPITEIITDPAYSGANTYKDFDYKTDSYVVVNGIDYSTTKNYCFTMYPFMYNADGSIDYKDSAAGWVCTSTQIYAPSKKDFEGIREAEVIERSLFINWNLPTNGIYSHFEVLYRSATNAVDTTFNFDAAIQATTVDYDFSDYKRKILSKDIGYDSEGNPELATFTTLLNLQNGYYNVGLLTYANLGNYVVRSERNVKIFQCYVDGTSATNCISI